MASNIELKQFVDDEDFINSMNMSFSDLRADYELTMDSSQEKIQELLSLHVDIKNQLSDLVSLSRNSSGTICGLRGTGKTHLLLLARHKLNSTLWKTDSKNNLCIYLNMKRLCLPPSFNQDLFNRIFSIFIYEELSSQLLLLLDSLTDKTLLQNLMSLFKKKEQNLKNNLEQTIKNIYEMIIIAHNGNETFRDLSTGNYETEVSEHDLAELTTKLNLSLTSLDSKLGVNIDSHFLSELTSKLKTNNTYMKYLNFQSVRTHLIDIISLLNIDSITFYVDEWEKISYNPSIQEYTAFYIDRIIDDPLYFWISIVPYRGSLYSLDNGADLQHQINLDESLIYEASSADQVLCITYFKTLIEKRLAYYFKDKQYNYKLLFNSDDNFSKLVLAGMGNTRDFGTMLLKCWSEYQAYRRAPMIQGRPYKYISSNMVIAAIKDNGDKKYTNIEDSSSTVKVWNDIKSFCISKNSSHFAIEEKYDSLNCLREKEFSDLIYHRLLHFRKAHVPAKDTSVENKLTIYAINYASSYTLHSQDRKISFITEYKTIHDRVRRYIYDPTKINNRIQIESGTIFPCINCGNNINTSIMVAAWKKNSCPFCGKKIYN